MDCNKIIDRICEDLSEDIDSELCQQLRTHLQECASCRTQVESMRLTVSLYRCLQQKDVPAAVHNRLLTLLNIPEI
ncbi:zf-HC2 domain-containing protein [candidate division KSB1 bacterium]|nr:zf-HC2 domain-containing protein [candidate division KSB1 bacterium]